MPAKKEMRPYIHHHPPQIPSLPRLNPPHPCWGLHGNSQFIARRIQTPTKYCLPPDGSSSPAIRVHLTSGFGRPVAWHFNVRPSPSLFDMSLLVSRSAILGFSGTVRKMRVKRNQDSATLCVQEENTRDLQLKQTDTKLLNNGTLTMSLLP